MSTNARHGSGSGATHVMSEQHTPTATVPQLIDRYTTLAERWDVKRAIARESSTPRAPEGV